VKGEVAKNQDVETDTENEDYIDNEQEDDVEVSEQSITKYWSRLPDTFGTIICDEAHKLKSPNVLVSRAVYAMNCTRHLFLSASIFMNNVSDLTGLLHIMWKTAG